MNDKLGIYVMAKPECCKYLRKLEGALENHGFKPQTIYRVRDWAGLSRAIYAPQLEFSEKEFTVGFEGHIWLAQHLFDNRGLVMVLEEGIDKNDLLLENKLAKLCNAKKEFRTNVSESLNGTLVMNIDLSKLKGEQFREGGIPGCLGVGSNGSFLKFDANYDEGRWEDFYFKYVHSTNPNKKMLAYEWGTLVNKGVISLDNLISQRDWELMKKLNTNTPPSEHGF